VEVPSCAEYIRAVRTPAAALARSVLALSLLFASACTVRAPPAARPPATPAGDAGYAADFDQFWSEIAENYCYFDEKQTDWEAVRQKARQRSSAIAGRDAFIGLLEESMDALHDAHASLRTNTAHSFRLVPSGTDLWAELIDGKATVTEVRPKSAAARAGLRAGQEIIAVGGVPVAQAIDARLGGYLRGKDTAARDFALRSLLAGRHDEPRRLSLGAPGGAREVTLDGVEGTPEKEPLEARRIEGSIGYVRVHNNLGDDDLVPAFDAALAELAGCPALILDLRDTPSGGNTGVAEALMGRFVESARPYQQYALPKAGWNGRDRVWLQLVTPRGPFTYAGTLVVLVDHWTGSMAEGMAIGFDGMARGTVIGTSMAGLRGAVHTGTLAKTGIGFAYPAERLSHVNGTPRERWQPPVRVDLAGQDEPGRDPILERALALIHHGNGK